MLEPPPASPAPGRPAQGLSTPALAVDPDARGPGIARTAARAGRGAAVDPVLRGRRG